MKERLMKLLSRKFILTVVTMALGAMTALNGNEFNEPWSLYIGAGIAALSAIAYVLTEGRIDAKAIELTVDAVDKITDIFDDETNAEEIEATEK